ncbi:MAG: hypothetical protein M3347_16900, partial [Armatimonadota bacterium]|nr:hypothetical protein [Armatimonadota bacterium]
MVGTAAQPSPGAPQGWVSFRLRDKNGHAFSYVGLFIFTAIVFFRPQDVFPALAWFPNLALVLGFFTLMVFVPTQIMLEGRVTARPREVNFVLLLGFTALLSLPLALDRSRAWTAFSGDFIKAIMMFIVMINVVRNERRLMGLLGIVVAVGYVLGGSTLNRYRLGELTIEGYRAQGALKGMFQDPNDMALYLVIVVPIA